MQFPMIFIVIIIITGVITNRREREKKGEGE